MEAYEPTFEGRVSLIENAPEYLRSVWRTVKALGLTSDDALISMVIGGDAAAPDYIIREVMEGTAADPEGAMSHGCFDGRSHRWNRKLSLSPQETDAITLPQLISLLATATGRR